MTSISRSIGLVAAIGAAALASTLVAQPAEAGPSTKQAAVAVAEQKPDCGELFLLLVPGAGEDAGPGTTLGRLRIRPVENIHPASAPNQSSVVDIYLWDRTVSP